MFFIAYNGIVNGYVYPSVDIGVLRSWLPSLTYGFNFSYGMRPNGDIINLDDDILIQEERNSGVGPFMVLTSLDESGTFSSDLITQVLESDTATNNLIDNILFVLQTKNLRGVDFDIEYIRVEDRDFYTALVQKTAERANPLGYLVTVALAPKQSREQRGLLYEGHDYGAMGRVANYVLLMTYEWGYTYSEPMAVAPINQVRKVLEYGLTEIPNSKIFMGIPNYGYDWQLPYVQGETRAETIGNEQAEERARQYGAAIMYDAEAQSPYYNYIDENGAAHEVWFENQQSWDAKIKLVEEYRLAGMSIWNIMRYFPAGAEAIDQLLEVEKV